MFLFVLVSSSGFCIRWYAVPSLPILRARHGKDAMCWTDEGSSGDLSSPLQNLASNVISTVVST